MPMQDNRGKTPNQNRPHANQNQNGGGQNRNRNQDGDGQNRNRNRRNQNQPAAPDIPTVGEWLSADPIYGTQKADINAAWERYKSGAQRATGRIGQQWGQAYGQRLGTGEFVPGEANIEKQRDLRDMMGDFAARGLGTSGVYAQNRQNYTDDWDRQRTQAMQTRDWSLQDIGQARGDQRQAVTQQLSNAEIEARLRRLGQYSLPYNKG